MHKIKNNPQVYTTQEGIEDIKNSSSGKHYPRGYAKDLNNSQVYTTQEGMQEIKKTLRYTLPKRVCKRLK